jgi:hypothetical protein
LSENLVKWSSTGKQIERTFTMSDILISYPDDSEEYVTESAYEKAIKAGKGKKGKKNER